MGLSTAAEHESHTVRRKLQAEVENQDQQVQSTRGTAAVEVCQILDAKITTNKIS